MKATKTRLPMLYLSLERVFRINLFMTPYSPAAIRDQNNIFILQTLPLHACLVVLKAEIETTKAGNQPPSSFHRIRLPFIFIQ